MPIVWEEVPGGDKGIELSKDVKDLTLGGIRRSMAVIMSRKEPISEYPDWNGFQTRLLWAYDGDMGGGRYFENRKTDHFSAWLVRPGSWIQATLDDGKVFRASPGEWLILPARPRTQEGSDSCHLLSVSFMAMWGEGTPLFDEGLPVRIASSSYPGLEKAGRKLVRIFATDWAVSRSANRPFTVPLCWPYDRYFRFQSALAQWMKALCDVLTDCGVMPMTPGHLDHRIAGVAHRLRDWHGRRPPDFSALAAGMGLSRRTLERLFAQHLGSTPYRFYDEAMLDRSKAMLSEPDSRIKSVAYSVGFHSLSQFSHWFKRHTGQSPRAYRQAFRAG